MGVQDRDWYQKEKDQMTGAVPGNGPRANSKPFPRSRESNGMHPVTRAVLALLGVALLWAMSVSFVQWRAQRMVEQVTRVGEESIREAQLQSERMQREDAER